MKQVMGNVIVGQSGGPTAVINSSLAGVFKTAKDRGAKKVYGMLHGIQGLLEERVVDLSEHIRSDLDIDLLKRTPSSFLGSCRYKLPPIKGNTEVYDKIFEILEKLEVEYFFYIGGNDSMDTIMKLSDYAILTSSKSGLWAFPRPLTMIFRLPIIRLVLEALQNTLLLLQKKLFVTDWFMISRT